VAVLPPPTAPEIALELVRVFDVPVFPWLEPPIDLELSALFLVV